LAITDFPAQAEDTDSGHVIDDFIGHSWPVLR